MSITNPLPTHPRTGLRALGVLPSGRIVWPAMGGDGTGDGNTSQGGNAGADPNGDGTGGDGGTGQNANGDGQNNDGGNQGQQGGQEPPTGPDGQPWDADRAARLVANLRQEIADLKGKQSGQQGQGQAPAPQQQNQQQAGQAPATDDGTADKLTAAQTELAVYRNAAKHGGNPVALADSKSFMDTVGKLDPDADDYDKQVADAIKKALETHPHYGTGQAPATSPRGGSDGTGRPGKPNRPRGLDGAVSAHYTKK